jgi:L,D-transpeptidase YcbB
MQDDSMKIARYLVAFCCILAAVRASATQQPLDSTLTRFYQARWWQPVWIRAGSLDPQASALLDVVARADAQGLDPADYVTPEIDSLLHRDLLPEEAWRLDTLLTQTFFSYARDVSIGRVEPSIVDSQWTSAPRQQDVVALLDRALDANRVGPALEQLAPPQPGYRALRLSLRRYRELAQQGAWPTPLARRLASEGYDTSVGVTAAVARFQTLHGLPSDGIVGPETRTQLDISPAQRAQQIALNLERWRWLPRSLGDRYVLVNSAAFSLQLVENDAVTLTMRAIVGRPDWPTPIVSSTATDLVFRPVWTVPRVIAVRELLPIIQRDPGYLTRAGFRVFGDSSTSGGELDPRAVHWAAVTESTFAYRLVQEPGPENPLGGVKLVFWTPFSVFIHDTPARPLFSERWRTFSHGCVRVEGAAALAARLLAVWPDDSIRAAMTSGRQRWVRLPELIPVHLVYWTAWTDDGLVAFTGDPYGWDEELARALAARGVQRVTMKGEPVR